MPNDQPDRRLSERRIHPAVAQYAVQELAKVQADVITLCLRLCLEPADSHSPETLDVLERWRTQWEAAAGIAPPVSKQPLSDFGRADHDQDIAGRRLKPGT